MRLLLVFANTSVYPATTTDRQITGLLVDGYGDLLALGTTVAAVMLAIPDNGIDV